MVLQAKSKVFLYVHYQQLSVPVFLSFVCFVLPCLALLCFAFSSWLESCVLQKISFSPVIHLDLEGNAYVTYLIENKCWSQKALACPWSRNSERFGGRYSLEPYKSKHSQLQDEDVDLIISNKKIKHSQLRRELYNVYLSSMNTSPETEEVGYSHPGSPEFSALFLLCASSCPISVSRSPTSC